MRYVEIESIIENAKMEQMIDENSNELISYRITPIKGYKLHTINYDEVVVDPETLEPTGDIRKGYISHPSFIQIGYNYDFEINDKEIYAVRDSGDING